MDIQPDLFLHYLPLILHKTGIGGQAIYEEVCRACGLLLDADSEDNLKIRVIVQSVCDNCP